MKRVIIVHGWTANPNLHWMPWVKSQLENRGYKVYIPSMPDTDKPVIEKWITYLSEIVGNPDEQTYLIGHSLGCQAIARFLETMPESTKIGGAIFVGGFFKRVTGFEQNSQLNYIDENWIKQPIDFNKVRSHILRSFAIFSDNDFWVPLDNQQDFKDKLGSEIIITHNMGHFTDEEGIVELPVVIESLLKISKVVED